MEMNVFGTPQAGTWKAFAGAALLVLFSGCKSAKPELLALSNLSKKDSRQDLKVTSVNPFDQDMSGNKYVLVSGECHQNVTSIEFWLDNYGPNPVPPTPITPGGGEAAPIGPVWDLDCSDGTFSFWMFDSYVNAILAANGVPTPASYQVNQIKFNGLGADLVNPTVIFARPPDPQLRIMAATGVQGGSLQFPVTLSRAVGYSVNVYFSYQNGTATSSTHFSSSSVSLTFSPGETNKNLSVPALSVAGEVCGPSRQFQVQIDSSDKAAPEPGFTIATGTIDDNKLPQISVIDSVGSENSDVSVTVALDQVCSNKSVFFSWGTGPDGGPNPAANDEFVPVVGGMGSIPAGDPSTLVVVHANDNDFYSVARTFQVILGASPTNATIGDGTGVVSINDTDGPPVISLSTNTNSIAEGASATVQVTASHRSLTAYVLNMSYTHGTTSGGDYMGTPSVLNFAPNDLIKSFNITAIDESISELSEDFSVSFSSGAGCIYSGTCLAGSPSSLAMSILASDPPNAPSGLTLANGFSSPGGVPFDVVVSGLQILKTVRIHTDATCSSVLLSITVSTPNQTLSVSGLPDGDYNFYADQYDGVQGSACVGPLNYIVDTTNSILEVDKVVQFKNESSAGPHAFTLKLNPVKPYPVTVRFNLTGSSLLAGFYSLINPSPIVIPPNTSTFDVQVNWLGDALGLGDQYLQMNLEGTSSGKVDLGIIAQARIYNYDDESTRSSVSKFSVGSFHTCASLSDGSLKCWGQNPNGQLGIGTTTPSLTPVTVPLADVTEVINGHFHTCAISNPDVNPKLYCWGWNSYGTVGNGTTSAAVTSPTLILSGVLNASAGYLHTCAVLSDTSVKCWGDGQYGKIGHGFTSDSFSPTAVSGLSGVAEVKVGTNHSCARKADGSVYCWGANGSGQLGDNSTTQRTSPVQVSGLSTAIEIATGDVHSCALLTGGDVKCWGANGSGQLGDNSTTQQNTPVSVFGITNAIHLAARKFATCAVLADQTVKCWGNNLVGQLGNGISDSVAYSVPVIVPVSVPITDISAGPNAFCARSTNSGLICWGDVFNTAFGNLATSLPLVPVQADDFTYSSFSVGMEHSCGVRSSKVFCSGKVSTGPPNGLGDGSSNFRYSGVEIRSTEDFREVSSGNFYSCGITTADKLFCWGKNDIYQLGVGGGTFLKPVAVDSLNTYITVSAGYTHTCAIRSDNKLFCWGSNGDYQVGDGTMVPRSTPAAADSVSAYAKVAVGQQHTCGIRMDNTLWCWGRGNHGQLGQGNTSTSSVPVRVMGPSTTFSEVSAKFDHTCAITMAGELYCWGFNFYGQVGEGSTSDITSPALIDSGVSYQKVSAGKLSTCGITSTGALKCWGYGASGALGNNDTSSSSTPSLADVGVNYQGVMVGDGFACGITVSGQRKCWGKNFSGEHGNGHRFNLPWSSPINFGL